MATKEGNHHIEEQVINLTINGAVDDQEVRTLQENFIFFYKEYIAAELQRIFDELVPSDVHITIDKLEIDLGNFSFTKITDLESAIRRKVRSVVEPQIKRKIEEVRRYAAAQRPGGSRSRRSGFSAVNILEHLLVYGHYPAWAGRQNGSIDELLDQLIAKKPRQLMNSLSQLGKEKKTIQRIQQQFSLPQLKRLFELLYGKQSSRIRKRLQQLRKRIRNATEKTLFSAAITYLLQERPESIQEGSLDERAFDRSIVETVQQQTGRTAPPSKVRPGFEEDHTEVQIIEYFLEHGAIPMWADVDSSRSLQQLLDQLLERKLVPLQRMLERQASKPQVMRRLVLQFTDEQLLQLLTPASEETVAFVEQTLQDLQFLTRTRQNITRTVSADAIRTTVFTEALGVFLIEKKSRLVKKTFLKTVLEQLTPPTRTDYTVLVKEAYKNVRRQKERSTLQPVLEQLDEQLQENLQAEREELRTAKRSYRQIERQLAPLLRQQEKGTLSIADARQLQQLQRQLQQLEQTMIALDEDQPLEIEQVVQQRQQLQEQLRAAEESEQASLQRRLERTEQNFERLQQALQKEVANLLRDKEKLHTRVGSIAEQRIKRVNNRLNKYQHAVKGIIQQLQLDQADITAFLSNINRSLRTNISNEEKQRLRQERQRLQKELIRINETIEALEKEEKALEEALADTLQFAEEGPMGESITQTTKLDLLLFQLQYGAIPWWAEKFPRQSIEELVLEFSKEEPRALLRAFQQVGKYPVVWERLVNQVAPSALRNLIIQLFPSDSQVILGQVELLRVIHFSQGFEQLERVEANSFVWSAVLEYLLTSRQPFNAQDFVKTAVLQTARTHALSPSKLLEFINNVATNRKEELGAFLTWNNNLLQDPATGATEREVAEYRTTQQQKQEGTYLTDEQKLELIVEYFSSGRFSERAKAVDLTTHEQFEQLFLEQMQNNIVQTSQVIIKLIHLSNARTFIIERLSDYYFWEIVYLIRPQAVLIAKRYFEDLRQLSDDRRLRLEKDVLLNSFINNATKGFDSELFVRQMLVVLQRETKREPLAVLAEWKRLLKARGTATRSTLLLTVMRLQVAALQEEQKSTSDPELRVALKERIQSNTQEYSSVSTVYAIKMAAENAEEQAANSEQQYTYTTLVKALEEHQQALDKLVKTYEETPPGEALRRLELERNIALEQAQIAQLNLKRPAILRKLEDEIEQAEKRLERLQQRAEQPTEAPILEAETAVSEVEPSLLERQSEVLELIEDKNPYVLEVLPPLLEDLQQEDQSHARFLGDVSNAAFQLPNERLQQAILDQLEPYTPKTPKTETTDPQDIAQNQEATPRGLDEQQDALRQTLIDILDVASIPPVAELQRMNDLDERQEAILSNFNQRSPFELWRDWEALELYFEETPEALTPARQRLQRLLYQAIRRREQQNLRQYVTNLRAAQRNLATRLDQANSLEGLETVQEELTTLWQQQQKQAEELVEVARDERSREDYQRFRRNVDRTFTNLQNRRIRQSNTLLQETGEELQTTISNQANELENLKQERSIQLQQLEERERRRAQQQQAPKKKRPKLPPIPAPVEEPLQIYNAGMVLLYPFITRLFRMLGYVKGKEFVDVEAQYKAIHMLQYIVTSRTQAPEHELLLNKVFCNFPVTEPVPFGIEFTPQELQTGESLLKGVIQNWPKMKNMTPNSLRGSFLIREGTIKEEEAKWQVVVHKQTFDILLKSIPWGYNFIRFPWSEKFITVEWKLM